MDYTRVPFVYDIIDQIVNHAYICMIVNEYLFY